MAVIYCIFGDCRRIHYRPLAPLMLNCRSSCAKLIPNAKIRLQFGRTILTKAASLAKINPEKIDEACIIL
ncbi:hypothetical protein [Psychrobacter sp. AH5]|uniref:hypothetical protein n=1 Tax=Psychrobacter sp. AH5 TaxID=2937433 RepID=UPI003340AAE9